MSHTDKFTWLHLTDFHFGVSGQPFLWPNLREPFYSDLRKLHGLTGPWNAVLFTGDLVQSGQSEEYKSMQRDVLDELKRELTAMGSPDTILLAVPGNHDVQRPDPDDDDAAVDALLKTDSFAEIEDKFWRKPTGSYRQPIIKAFENYETWATNSDWIPTNKLTKGELPGDFSTTIEAGNRKIGIIGLNTTFLQLSGGNFKGRLEWHPCQIHAVCKDGIDKWAKEHDICILMTHQGPDWLSPKSLALGNVEIVPAGRFAMHLFGHEHKTGFDFHKKGGGADSVRLIQCRSVFGLDKYGEPPTVERSHGYMVGRVTFGHEGPTVCFWPRIATNKPNGWRFVGDQENCILDEATGCTFPDAITSGSKAPSRVPGSIITLANAADNVSTLDRLSKLRTRPLLFETQHSQIRRDEARRFKKLLSEQRYAWLAADWQMGKEGFLADCIRDLAGEASLQQNIYRIDCGGLTSVDGIVEAAGSQLGLSFVEFADAVKSQKGVFLLLEDVPPQLLDTQDKYGDLNKRIQSILEFSPELGIVIISRIPPANVNPGHVVQLAALEITETRAYAEKHPQSKPVYLLTEALNRIHGWTGGVPSIIDRLLLRGQTLTLDQIIGEADREDLSDVSEPVPQSLIDAVDRLKTAEDDTSSRSYLLLKLLTVLKDGETFESIRTLYPKKPFHQAHVRHLTLNQLIESVEISQTASDLSPRSRALPLSGLESPRLLRIPRQVRDYVGRQIPAADRAAIFDCALEAFFGRKWHKGKVKLRSVLHNAYQRSTISGPGNELLVIQFLLDRSLASGRKERIAKYSRLAIDYCQRLLEQDRFRDVEVAARVATQLLADGNQVPDWVEVAFKLGRALRMTGQHEEAIQIFLECLEKGDDFLIKSFKASIHLNLAMAFRSLKNDDRAIEHVGKTIELEHKDSSEVIQATAIAAEIQLHGTERTIALRRLYTRARNKSHTVTANNIALDLAKTGNSEPESLKLLNSVIKSAADPYNKARGIADKATLLKTSGKLKLLSPEEEDLLCAAYSYSYTQRMTKLIEECHGALWDVYNSRGIFAPLFRLFRYTSFFLRLCGKDSDDKVMVAELSEKRRNLDPREVAIIPIEIRYFERRHDIFSNGKIVDV